MGLFKVGITMVTLLLLWACQGFNERLPSQAQFEVQRPADDSSQDLVPHGERELVVENDPQASLENFEMSSQAVSLSLSIEASFSHSFSEDKLHCRLEPSLLGAALLRDMRQPLKVSRAQSSLWIELEIGSQLKEVVSSLAGHALSTETGVNHIPYDPTSDQAGAWVIYQAIDGSFQSVILTKNAPWMCDRAWVIARCETNETLTLLTSVHRSLNGSISSSLQLKLVSESLRVHAVPADP